MKTIKLLLISALAIFVQSCYKPGTIRIQNKIEQVKIQDVKWGDIYVATDLLPGETSEKIKIDKYEEKLPSKQRISFKMTANNKSIYLETVADYLLEEDGELLIVLDDNTEVKNPNE